MVEAGGLGLAGHPQWYIEFEASLDFMRSYVQKKLSKINIIEKQQTEKIVNLLSYLCQKLLSSYKGSDQIPLKRRRQTNDTGPAEEPRSWSHGRMQIKLWEIQPHVQKKRLS